jgi:transposase-like protein
MSSLIKLFKKFPTEESCIEYLESVRFAKGYYCLYCGSTKVYKHRAEDRPRLQCGDCHKSFKVTVGTIFHNTKLDLRKWFWLVSLMISARKGISSHQVARELEMRQATVWSVMHRIRKALKTEQAELLKGIFQMDETYIKNSDNDDNHKGGHSNKTHTSVVAIKEKDGDLKAFVTTDTKYSTLCEIAMNTAELGSEFHTDEYKSYVKFKYYFKHKTVNHSVEYVSADGINTNSIEGFWSLLKRGIKGNFHFVTKKYLKNYVTEFEFRYNNRQNELVFGDVLAKLLKNLKILFDKLYNNAYSSR